MLGVHTLLYIILMAHDYYKGVKGSWACGTTRVVAESVDPPYLMDGSAPQWKYNTYILINYIQLIFPSQALKDLV